MFYLNNIQMVGRATRDAEFKSVGESSQVATFRLVCNKRMKKRNGDWGEKATFVDCEAWGKRAEFARDNVLKGTPVYIQGELEQDEWKTKDGEQRQKLKIYISNITLVERKKREEDQDRQPVGATDNSDNGLPF